VAAPHDATRRDPTSQSGLRGASLSTRATAKEAYVPTSAKDAIDTGLKIFATQRDEKGYAEAARLFKAATEMNANDEEMCAALYNLGCAYSKLKMWKPAADAITRAVNDYRLKVTVALEDNDLRALRDRREWVDALTEIKGGMSRDMKIQLRSEARAPFRFPRFIILGGFFLSAALGLFVTILRLVKAVQGGEGAPDMTETLQNFGINAAVAAVLAAILWRDNQEKQKSARITDREELLSRLQIDLGNGRVLPLLRFRGKVRMIILAGAKSFVDKAVKEADKYYEELRARGVSLVPLVVDADVDPQDKLKKLKRELNRRDTSKGFAVSKPASAEARQEEEPAREEDAVKEEDKKWKLAAYDTEEWAAWVTDQRSFSNLKPNTNCYIQVQLDGTVRTSGLNTPNWPKLLDDLPTLDSVRTAFTDGIGPSI